MTTVRMTLAAGPWLDADRATAARRVLLAVMLAVAIGWIAASRGGIDPAGKPIGTDYASFWAAGRLALAGHADAAWNVAAHWAVQREAFGADVAYAAFFYPPPFLLICAPFAALPYLAALAAWLAATGAAYVVVCLRWAEARPGALLALLAYPAVLLNLGHGQNGFLTAALLGGGLLAIRRDRAWLAGLLLGTLVIKPHLALLLPVALMMRAEWRTLVATGLTAVAWCAASWLILGPDAWSGFLAASAMARATLEQGLVEPGKMVSLFAAVRVLGGSVPLAYAAQALLAGGAIATLALLARRRVARSAQDAALIAATLVTSPFLLDYDLTAMALPLAWLWVDRSTRGYGPGEREAMAALYAAPLLLRPIALGLSLPLGPLATTTLLALVAAPVLRPSPCRR